jgi:hypothetical protein
MNLIPDPAEGKTPEAQLDVLVKRMEDFISTYLAQAEKMEIEIHSSQILDLVDRALLKVQKIESSLAYEKTVTGYFLEGMLEDLIQQPENIFEQVTTPEGESVYAPLSDAVWISCLKKLRQNLIKILQE